MMCSIVHRAASVPCRAVLAALFCVAVGCSDENLPATYGQLRGKSVNGTGVLGEMLKARGHTVGSARYLSPKLNERADVLIWFAGEQQPPTREARLWLEEWLQAEPGRVLIYVINDYDAAPEYWRRVAIGAPPNMQVEYRRREAAARANARNWATFTTALAPKSPDEAWFKVDGTGQTRDVRTLSGEDSWRTGIDPSKLEIILHGRFTPARTAYPVLTSDGDMLVSREYIGDSSLFVVANGSFLLNMPLVNHEHRKLAERLIDELEYVEDEPRKVVFLQSGWSGLSVYEEEPNTEMPGTLAMVARWPLNAITLQLAALGLLFSFMRWPIFGSVRVNEPPGTGDFGRHIVALGEMLMRTKDRTFAKSRLATYEQALQKDGRRGRPRSRGKPIA